MRILPALVVCTGLWAVPEGKLTVLPDPVELQGPEARQQLLAQFTDAAGAFQRELTRKVEWSSSNPSVARVDARGLVTPVGDGEATITARGEGLTASTRVRVRGARSAFTWSFRNHVIPVLTKAGCNQGACHGALAGKNGFKLTLRGYDPDLDYDALTRQSAGRRVSLAEPAHSLVLLKPTMVVPHGGGLRFKTDSLEYRVVSEWIAAGAPPPAAADPEVVALEVYPRQAVLQPGAEQQLVVRARYSDGQVDDVTRWVKYSSNNEGAATVDDHGLVKMTGRGEAAITLWYNSRVLYSRLTVPFDHPVDASVYSRFQRQNFIDDHVLAKWKSLNLAPSNPASDAVFLRRAFLDAAGILPTAEEVERFLADRSAGKRARLIDQLLEREEFVDYWAYQWSDLLLVSSRKLRGASVQSFYNWIRDSVKANKPWDKFVYDLFTATGSSRENGALNYFVLHKDPIQLAENATQAFLGQRLTCARCHNHPMEKWTQKQYYQFANLFARIGVKNGADPGEQIVFARASGDVNHPRLLRPLEPTPLDGKGMPIDAPGDRRVVLARWLTSPENEMFSRSLVNRVWGNFMGRGLVDPIDDLRATNPASNEELLAALTKDFVDHGFDVKRLIRTIMNSGVYQLSSEANATNQNDSTYYSRYVVKRLPAEVLLDALSQVTGVPTSFSGYPRGTRALQLPDTQVQSQFLTSFGRPQRVICDAGERTAAPSIAQALHVINGDTLNRKLSAADGYLSLMLRLGLSDARIVEHLYLSALSRYPSEAESAQLQEELARSVPTRGPLEARKEARRQALEDMAWALLTSKEFLFNY